MYFAGSIRGVRNGREKYLQIVNHLSQFGTVLTEHVAASIQDIENQQSNLDDHGIHDRDMKWLMECNLVVAECSVPSLGVGYEIGRALENEKTVVVIYNSTSGYKLSAMISGSEKCEIINYETHDDLFKKLDKLIEIKKAESI